MPWFDEEITSNIFSNGLILTATTKTYNYKIVTDNSF